MNTNVTKAAAGRIIALVLNVSKAEHKLADELRTFVGKIDPELVGAELRAYWTSKEAGSATAGVNPVRPLLQAAALAGWSKDACLKFGGDTAGNGHDGPARGLGLVTRQRVGQLVKPLFDESSAVSVDDEGDGEGEGDGGGSEAGNAEKQLAKDRAKFCELAAKLTFSEAEIKVALELMQADPAALAAKAAAEKEAAAAAKAAEKESAAAARIKARESAAIAKSKAKEVASAALARVQAHRARAKEKAEKEAEKKRAAAKKAVAAAFKASKKQAVKSLSGK